MNQTERSLPDAEGRRTRGERPRPQRRVRQVLLALAGLAFALLLAEGTVRLFRLAPAVYRIRPGARESAYQLSDDPLLGYELKRNWRDDDPDLHSSFPRTNAHGQRDIERTMEKPEGVYRILVLGDSVVVGNGLWDLNDTIPRQLEKILARRGIEVLNFGVSGYCTASEVELLEAKGLAFSPDLVIVVFTENDYMQRNEEIVSLPPSRPRFAESLFVHSHLFRLLALTTNLWGFREATDPSYHVRKNEEAVGRDNVERALPRLLDLAKREGFQTFMVLWPAFTDLGIEDRHRVVQVPGRMMVEIFADWAGLRTFRLSPYFRQDWARRHPREPESWARRIYTIGDHIHPSEDGSRTAAEALASILDSNPEYLRRREDPIIPR